MENLPLFPNLDEIVFRNRNKEYGAYDLRRSYVKYTTRALIIGILLFLLLFIVPAAINYINEIAGADDIVVEETIATLEEPPPMNEEEEQPEVPPVEPPPPPQRAQVKFVPPEVVEHEEAPPEETIATIDTLQEIDAGTEDVEGDIDAPPDIGYVEEGGTGEAPVEVKVVEKDPEPDEFIFVQEQPKPVNLDDIKKRIVYPQVCKDAQIQGKVYLKILVDKEGKPTKHVVKRSPHDLLTQACVKEIYKLKFTPAIQAGKPVKFWVMVPFNFNLR